MGISLHGYGEYIHIRSAGRYPMGAFCRSLATQRIAMRKSVVCYAANYTNFRSSAGRMVRSVAPGSALPLAARFFVSVGILSMALRLDGQQTGPKPVIVAAPAGPVPAPQTPGASGTPPAPGAAVAPPDSARYIISPEDTVQVTVWKEPSFSGSIPVRPDGMISLSLVGDLPAARAYRAGTADSGNVGVAGNCGGRWLKSVCEVEEHVYSSRRPRARKKDPFQL